MEIRKKLQNWKDMFGKNCIWEKLVWKKLEAPGFCLILILNQNGKTIKLNNFVGF